MIGFASGEWSPNLSARVDQSKYRAACIQLRNMICLRSGPATRRAGTQYVNACKVISGGGDYAVRSEDFLASDGTAYTLEVGHHYIRFYTGGTSPKRISFDGTLSVPANWGSGQNYPAGTFRTDSVAAAIYYTAGGINGGTTRPALDATNWVQQTILEVPTPYSASIDTGETPKDTDVFQLVFCPINDVIYIVHPDYPMAKITRYSSSSWIYEEVVALSPALLDENATDTTIASSATRGSTTLTATAPDWATSTYYEAGASVKGIAGAGTFVIGQTYTILVVGTTNFTLIGASANTIGVVFVATGAGAGTGTATALFNCLIPHVSGTFATDVANHKWIGVTIFQSGHVSSYWKLANLNPSASVEYAGTSAAAGFANGSSSSITAFGKWTAHTYGVWSADISIERSDDDGATWSTVGKITGRNDRNADLTGTADSPGLYRITVGNNTAPTTPGANNPRVVFESVDAFLFGIVQISAVANAYSATATVLTQLPVSNGWISGKSYAVGDRVSYLFINYVCTVAVSGATAPPSDGSHWSADGWPTTYWSEGAWSAVRGYPRALTLFEQRVVAGFTEFEPQRLWGTVVGDFENYELGTQENADDGFAFDLDALGDGNGFWLQSGDVLFCGMEKAEWVVGPSDSTGGAIGPTNIFAHRQSRWGSTHLIPAIQVGDSLIFPQRQRFSIRQMLFSIVTSKYMSQDLTPFAEHIFNGGVTQLAYQRQGQKNGFVWGTTENGELVGLTYDLDQEVFGWHRHFTGLDVDTGFESICCISGQELADDELWAVVNRHVGGSDVRYMERVNPLDWQNVTPDPGGTPGYLPDKNKAYYVDCGVTRHNPVSNVFTGLAHLNGRSVSVCINAQDYTEGALLTVSGGQITVDSFVPTADDTYVQIGLPFTSTVQPMNLDVDVHTGATTGLQKKVTGLYVSLLNTLALAATDGGQTDLDVTFRMNTDGLFSWLWNRIFTPADRPTIGQEPQLYSGIVEIKDFAGSYDSVIPVILYTEGPLPLSVLGVSISYGISGTP